MSKELATINTDAIEKALIKGDLSGLTPEQKVSYYNKVCESVGLNPFTKPFDYIEFKGKQILYALRACTEQLRKIHGVSLRITSREMIGDVYVVTAQAKLGEREDESTGAVHVKGLVGENLANAYMKAETKAKRRVTLSVCGLAFLDETEVETIAGVKHIDVLTGEKKPELKLVEQNEDPGEYVVRYGKKYVGKKLKDIDDGDLTNFMDWIEKEAKKPLSDMAQEFYDAANKYIDTWN